MRQDIEAVRNHVWPAHAPRRADMTEYCAGCFKTQTVFGEIFPRRIRFFLRIEF